MKPRRIVFTLLLLAGVFGRASASAPAAPSGCIPNGNRFNLESLTNAVSQFNESVAFLPSRGGNGADLVVGTAMDERALPPLGFLSGVPADAFYVQRDSSSCRPDSEGELPQIATSFDLFDISGSPQVVADPAHDAFFVADLRFSEVQDNHAVGILKATAANLLNPTTCPNGTQQNPGTCWGPNAGLLNVSTLNAFEYNPALAVDQRTSGTGAGDVYAVVAQADPNDTQLTYIYVGACNNVLTACSGSVLVSGADTNTSFPWVQVRPDGGITISYAVGDTTISSTPAYFRFVNCTPGGAPNPPTCSAPIAAVTEPNKMLQTFPGDVQFLDDTYPKHVDRLESDGKTVTTFLVYDRCEVAVPQKYRVAYTGGFCPKTDVVVTSSSDGGNTWSPPQKVSPSPGQQFLGNVALDASTETVNIGYYSTENDPVKTRTQIFLAQIPPGQTSVGTVKQITSSFYDGPIPSVVDAATIVAHVSYIGVAAAGTGKPGQSHVYVHFTGSTVQGIYGGVPFPVTNNILTGSVY